ncbi:alpha/beta fold hydrolase [Azorhizobium doebereinerae]|uniref:alpha/beta fold hydrolase n=1 Tax=Azorhizobium doebereinerae TaxID=281091 RepID=UPI000408E05A|nr:alpha/beta fold hydrolase [Azorhizobium doebereinerae]
MTAFATSGGLRIAYDLQGDGPALLLIGGLSADRAFWSFARPHLSAFRTLAFDNRDIGASDRAEGAYAPVDMARDALAVMDAAGIGKAHVLGHSLGGAIAQELALLAPERVDRLVLACSFARPDLYVHGVLTLLKRLRAELADPVSYVSALATFTLGRTFLEANGLEDIARAALVAGPLQEVAAFQRQADATRKVDTLARLGGIAAPTLVLSTPEDRFFGQLFSDAIAAAIPGARQAMVGACGHCPMIEAPERFAAAVSGFLRGR